MMKSKPARFKVLKRRKPLVLGFLPENDCAPLVVAQELGLFKEYGLDVELSCEATWKSVQEKLAGRELHAAQAPGALPFLMNLKLIPESCDCVAGMVLSLQGNAITVSRELWGKGVHNAATLGEHVMRGGRKLTFGVTCPLSAPYWLLCQWLKQADLPAAIGLRVVTVSDWEMFPMLKLGYLDGFCAGEPWSSLAAQAGVGICVSSSAELAPMHPEKVLIARRDFAETRAGEHERLIAALIEACRFCDQPEHRSWVCQLLGQPQFVNAPVESLEPGLCGPFAPADKRIDALHGLNIFHRGRANEPTTNRADWITGRLYEFLRWTVRPSALDKVFRPDIFRRASKLVRRDNASGSPRIFLPEGQPKRRLPQSG
jgi:ABC-type nitrate/sulfonate/bicarbonate transport system substrate-binding protein